MAVSCAVTRGRGWQYQILHLTQEDADNVAATVVSAMTQEQRDKLAASLALRMSQEARAALLADLLSGLDLQKPPRVVLGTDHAGYALKEVIKNHLFELGIDVIDEGTFSDEPVDYPN